jgi:uncharacterized tellurite resistance protein B-like protein
MFLNRLNQEEKVAFLEIAHHIARSDNDFSEDQKTIIAKYCMEMQIEDIDFNESGFDLSITLSKIKNEKSQKIALLEVMALVYSDSVLHEEEKKVLSQMVSGFGLSESLTVIYAEWSKAMLSLFIQGNALIEL